MAEPKNIKRKVRTLQVVATLSIAMMLFLLGGGGYLVAMAMKAGGQMQERATIHVFMLTTADSATITKVGEALTEFTEIKAVAFKSKQQALEEFRSAERESVEDFMEFLGENPLPDSYEIALHKEYSTSENLAELENRILTLNGVDEVVYQKTTMANLSSNINKFNLVLLLFGGALLLVTLVLLGNTIRLTIYSRRHTISTMKLVGASKWFVMRPFVRESIVQGVIAWIVSGAMFVLLVGGINERIHITQDNIWIWILGVMFVVGIGVSVLFTIASVNKFVRMNTAKIEIY